ncbi:phosphodiester glycosidase family protein [bacterium]|nr:MAG: phosphodiester glycosidase family protein [bacterium]
MIAALPARLTAPPPFPAVIAQQRVEDEVAPGVERAEYDLRTADGPLVIHVIVADLSNPEVSVRTARAQQLDQGHAETVRAMALRTGAVAAINGDFFDIDRSNQPTNVLEQDGALLHPPGYGRPAVGIQDTGSAVIGTPALEPDPTTGPDVTIDGVPVVQAVGGGPLLLRDGEPADDPTAPANGTARARFPVAGVGIAPPDSLLLVEADGHQPGYSIGLTRGEFAALFQGLGAREAMGLDSGGSATIVARPLGEAGTALLNHPSDGRERPVADALEILSSAPAGPPARLVVDPRSIRTVPGAEIALRIGAVDAGDHPAAPPGPVTLQLPASLGQVQGTRALIAPSAAGNATLEIRSGSLSAQVPIEVTAQVARLEILAPTVSPTPGESLHLQAAAYDAAGHPLAVQGAVRWSVSGGGRMEGDTYLAPAAPADAVITAVAGGARASLALGTGRHRVALPWQPAWFRFVSYPAGAGALGVDAGCGCLALRYDFTQRERAAYARTALVLGGHPIAFSLDVDGDGGGEWLRLRIADAHGRHYALTLARAVDWNGWRRVEAALPQDAPVPLMIEDVYLVAREDSGAGSVRLRDPALAFPGLVTPTPLVTRPPQTR